MLEDPQIKSILDSISPELSSILNELYKNSVLNFQAHDESSYDVDRYDYIFRDNLYVGTPVFIPYSHYETVSVALNNDGIPETDCDGSIITSDDSNSTIDVYDYSSLENIEQLLEIRENCYKRIYFSSKAHIRENTLESFFKSFLSSQSKVGKDLQNYIKALSACDINDIDLYLFLEWDDIKFYSQILEIAECHDDPNVRLLATMTIPNMNEFLTMIYSHLGMYAKDQNYTEADKQFLQKLKSLIKGNSTLSQNLKNPNFSDYNTLIFEPEKQLPNAYDNYIKNELIHSSSVKVKAYKSSEPIYIRDKNNKIYELSAHPNRKYNWNTRISFIKSKYAYVPFLRLHGISDSEIEKLRNYSLAQSCEPQTCKVNMQPLQVSHNIENSFLEL